MNNLNTQKNIYFASDFHLGYPNREHSLAREKRIIEWLNTIKPTCKELYLLGDIFDFWYEYKWVVPKGNIRFLAKIAEFVDDGIPVNMFMGNHDEWLQGYLVEECGVTIYQKPIKREYNGVKMYIHHGHALGKYDRGMNFLHWVFTNKFLQWMFSRIHPNTAFGFANRWSRQNRKSGVYEASNYLGDENEWLLHYSKDVLETEHFDYFIYGHRHLAIDKKITDTSSTYINTGNWITNTSYAIFDGEKLETKIFKPDLFPNEKIVK